ncbi:hypothetical protein HPB50_008692 [Hyalomma asiaticum]|uniref:Uncharacterized protein n=1 Tax=Hyalomma asiaticum TaxID=266040 RepID=A0ACB7RV76_HYAAI|nr:hypothetical protein HPB50_008692 [Hyalomma asiaticum]
MFVYGLNLVPAAKGLVGDVMWPEAAVGTLWSLWLSSGYHFEGPAEHKCAPRCLIYGGSHLTGAPQCRDKYRKPIKPRLPPSNTERTSAPKRTSSTKVNNKKSHYTPGKPGQVKATDNAETRKQAPPFNACDFPSLSNAKTKVSGWVGAAPEPLSPSATEVDLQRQNAGLRCHTEIVAKKIHELEAKFARLAEPEAEAGSSEPMQQTEPGKRLGRVRTV